MSRIGIDARFFGPGEKGLGRYTAEIVRHLTRIDSKDEFVLFVRRPLPLEFRNIPNIQAIEVDIRWYSFAEQVSLPAILRQAKCDLYHFPHFNVPIRAPRPYVVTVHDLILSKYPTVRASTLGPLRYWVKHAAYKWVIRNAIRRASLVIAVSEFTKTDLVKNFQLDPSKIIVTYEAAESFSVPGSSSDDVAVIKKYNLTSPFVLFVGNAYPHKNLERLVAAFDRLSKSENLELVLIGRIDEFYRRLQQTAKTLGLESRIRFLGWVPDADLPTIYRRARVFVFPSLYEGFGLPPLEAMFYGTPVATARSSSLPEILGESAEYFNPENVDDMIRVISSLLHDDRRRAQLQAAGQQQVKKYSWRRCAEATLAVYRSVLTT